MKVNPVAGTVPTKSYSDWRMISGFTGSAVQVIGLSSIYLTAVGIVQFLYG